MDVRCEKCLTIYEFDEAQIGPNGVTVKCTQCGNLFKVKRKETTAELQSPFVQARSPAYTPPASQPASRGGGPAQPNPPRPGPMTPRSTHTGIPQLASTVPMSQPRERDRDRDREREREREPAPAPAPSAAPPTADEPKWMVRIKQNGQVYSFREMTTLQQWIVERKVTRKDEISRDGAMWKTLGGVPELEPFFQIVDQASAPKAPPAPSAGGGPGPGDDLAFTTTERMRSTPRDAGGPTSMGDLHTGDDPAFATTTRKQKAMPAAMSMPPVVDELADMDLERPARRKRTPLVVAAVGGVVTGLAILIILQRDSIKKWFGGGGAPKVNDAIARARAQAANDTDDDFRQAAEILAQAHTADENDARVTAALAEVHATWGYYLREDARALDQAGAAGGAATEAVARRLRKDAQTRIDDAKKYAAEALQRAPDDPAVNRAMADYQRVDGAPAAEVERYLKRALDKSPGDADAVFVSGALALRDGRLDDARVKLEQANQLAASTRERGLLRAELLLARLALTQGRRDDARRYADAILVASPSHERARALLSLAQAAPAPAPVDAGVAHAAPDMAPAKTAKKPGADDGEMPQTYDKLVEKADHLSENGRSDAARKLYERALELSPSGVEAMTGLGYCDLDKERFMAAIDHFKRALTFRAEYGEAIIGIAEAYKVRGDRVHAIEYYKRYLKAQPNGGKAAMAQKNLHDMEAAMEREKPPTPPSDKPPEGSSGGSETPKPQPTPDEPPP
jgi:predicted Zn finger-like uncharacterized protein